MKMSYETYLYLSQQMELPEFIIFDDSDQLAYHYAVNSNKLAIRHSKVVILQNKKVIRDSSMTKSEFYHLRDEILKKSDLFLSFKSKNSKKDIRTVSIDDKNFLRLMKMERHTVGKELILKRQLGNDTISNTTTSTSYLTQSSFTNATITGTSTDSGNFSLTSIIENCKIDMQVRLP